MHAGEEIADPGPVARLALKEPRLVNPLLPAFLADERGDVIEYIAAGRTMTEHAAPATVILVSGHGPHPSRM